MSGFMRVIVTLAALGLMTAGCSEQVSSPTVSDVTVFAVGSTGHGGVNGPHYNLNIIGVSKDKTAAMDNNNGHRVFVKLWGNTKIWLAEGDKFQVLDANGTDGDGAKFQLPDPDPDDDLVTRYSVYARALGRPGGWSHTTTCFIDENGDLYCSMDTLTLARGHGKQKFTNVSKELLTVYADIDGDGVPERVGLFDNDSYDYFWSYDNHGLKLAQLRFYPVATDVSQ